MTRGVTAYGAYTISKSITNSGGTYGVLGAGTGIGVADTYDRTLYKMLDPDDRTHMVKAMVTWDLPFGKGRSILATSNPILNAVVGGWNVAAIMNYSSGIPLGAPSSLTRPVGWNGPGVVANFNTPAGVFMRVFNPDTFDPWNRNNPGNRFFDPSVFTNASPQDLGSSPPVFPQVRMLWTWNEDISMMKRFAVAERVRLELRLSVCPSSTPSIVTTSAGPT